MLKISYLLIAVLSLLFSSCSDSTNNSKDNGSKAGSSFTISKAPINDLTPVSTLQMLSLEFSVPIDKDTVTPLTVYIVNDLNTSVDSELVVENNNTKVTIKPNLYLEPSTTYSFIVTTGLKSAGGESLSKPYIYTFTTKDDSTDDGVPVSFLDIKPSDTKTDVSVYTDISIQFNKDIAPITDKTGLIVLKDSNGTEVSGNIDFFNSTVSFTPENKLATGTLYTVTLDGSKITDMYGNAYDNSISVWNFTTTFSQTEFDYGYKSLADIFLATNAKKLFKISQYPNDMLVVVSDNALNFVSVYMDNVTKRPTLEHLGLYDVNETIYGSYNLYDVMFIATQDKINELSVDENGTVSEVINPIPVDGKIYDLAAVDGRVYAVGPEFGFKVYEDANADDKFELFKDVNMSGIVPVNIEISKGSEGTRIHVADYKGGVYHYDANATFVSKTDLNGSTRDMKVVPDDFGGDTALFVSNSIGKSIFLDLNGSVSYLYPNDYEMISSANGISVMTPGSTESIFFVNNRQKGVEVYNTIGLKAYINSSADIVYSQLLDLTPMYGVLATIDYMGGLKIYNAYDDTYPPYVINASFMDPDYYITPILGQYVLQFDDILDVNSSFKDSFSLVDGNSFPVDFNISVSIGLNDTNVTIVSGCAPTNCTLSISSSLKDIVGNSMTPSSYLLGE